MEVPIFMIPHFPGFDVTQLSRGLDSLGEINEVGRDTNCVMHNEQGTSDDLQTVKLNFF